MSDKISFDEVNAKLVEAVNRQSEALHRLMESAAKIEHLRAEMLKEIAISDAIQAEIDQYRADHQKWLAEMELYFATENNSDAIKH